MISSRIESAIAIEFENKLKMFDGLVVFPPNNSVNSRFTMRRQKREQMELKMFQDNNK